MKNKTFLKQLFFSFVCALILILLIISVKFSLDAYHILNLKGINQLQIDTKVNFISSILGAGISIFGVAITLCYEHKEQLKQYEINERNYKDSLAIKYRPILDIENYNIVKTNNVNDDSYNLQFNICNEANKNTKTVCRIYFELVNLGRGEVQDLIVEAKCKSTNDVYNCVSYSKNDFKISLLAKNCKLRSLINIKDIPFDYRKKVIVKLIMKSNYSNLNKTYKYEYDVEFKFSVTKSKTKGYVVKDPEYIVKTENVVSNVMF